MSDAPRANPVLGNRLFTADAARDVYHDDDGRKYVPGDDGERVCGLLLFPDADNADGHPVGNGDLR